MLARATLCTTFQTGTSPTGTVLSVIGGSVALDGKAFVRSTLDITVDGTRNWPIFISSPLAPYGNEIFIERGIEYSDGLVEYVKLGYHRIQAPEQSTIPSSDSPIRIVATDRMQAIIEGRLLAPRQFLVGTTYGSVVASLINEIYPAAVIEWDDATNTQTLTRSVIIEEDRYAFINDLVTSLGKIWYWDYRGVLVVKNTPSATSVNYTVNHGTNGTLSSFARTLTREGAYNAVVVAGEGPDTQAPVRGVAIDNNSSSPTYFYGRFGQVPRFYTSQFLTTTTQCQTAALALLNQQLGLPYTLNFGDIVNPALEPYDVVEVKFSHNEAEETHILDTVDIPLTQDAAQSATTREQRVVLAVTL
jgi:Domain of unknown function (DUF5047)